MKTLAIIITVYNRKNKTLQCLRNIKEQYIQTGNNIIVDIYLTNDGCTDGTPEAILENYPDVNVIEGDGSLFWNRGMYVAWQEAAKQNYDFYLWLNDDNLKIDALERLLLCSISKEEKAIVIGSCCSSMNDKTITYGGYSKEGKLITNVEFEQKCKVFNGNIVLIPRYVFEQIGFNDHHYHHALGDFDYSLKAYNEGIESFVAKGVYGICDLHESLPKWCDPNVPLCERWKAFHKPGGNGSNPFEFFYYKKKNYGIIPACVTFISNYIHVLFPKLWHKKN